MKKTILLKCVLFSALFSQAQNLIEYYPLNNGSSIGKLGTSGTATSTTLAERNTDVNEAIAFNGTNSLALGNPQIDATNGFTISFWYKPSSNMTGPYNIVISKRAVCNVGNQFNIFHNATNGTLNFSVRKDDMGTFQGGTNLAVTNDKWQFVTFVIDNTNKEFLGYIDGVEKSKTDFSNPNVTISEFAPNTDLVIANSPCYGVDNTNLFVGAIDEIKLYNINLTPSKIKNNYSCELSPAIDHLIECYPLNDGSSVGEFGTSGTETSTTLAERNTNLNEAVEFSGSNFLALGNPQIDATNGFTISFWYKPSSSMTGVYNIVLSKRAVCNVGNQFNIFHNTTNGTLNFSVRKDDMGTFQGGTNLAVTNDKWQFVTFVIDNTKKEFIGYVDGVEKSKTVFSNPNITISQFAPNTDLVIANTPCYGIDNTRLFVGAIDEIKLYDVNLNLNQIAASFDNHNLVSGIQESDVSIKNSLIIYPNPVTNHEINISNTENWTIFTSTGTEILSGTSSKINVSSLEKGIYIIKSNSNNEVSSATFVVE
jgi:hypothetical protein